MKYIVLKGLYVLAVILTAAMAGCEKSDNRISDEGIFFLRAAKNTLPLLEENTNRKNAFNSEIQTTKLEDTWGIDNPLYLIFSMFQDYIPESDNGTVGIDNIYKILHMTGTFFDDAFNNGESIPDQHIESPFDLGNNQVTYNYAINDPVYQTGSAVKQEGNINYGLHSTFREISGVWTGAERSILQGQYNKATHDLKIDLLSFLDLDVKDIGLRISIEGNDSTHIFTVKYIKYATNETFSYGVGHGNSKGAGNYFLFKFSVGLEDPMAIQDAYYCIEATDTDEDMKNMNISGVSEIIPQCTAYKNIVDNITPFTKADLPSSAADFNKGGTGTASEGSMYLDFYKK